MFASLNEYILYELRASEDFLTYEPSRDAVYRGLTVGRYGNDAVLENNAYYFKVFIYLKQCSPPRPRLWFPDASVIKRDQSTLLNLNIY